MPYNETKAVIKNEFYCLRLCTKKSFICVEGHFPSKLAEWAMHRRHGLDGHFELDKCHQLHQCHVLHQCHELNDELILLIVQ